MAEHRPGAQNASRPGLVLPELARVATHGPKGYVMTKPKKTNRPFPPLKRKGDAKIVADAGTAQGTLTELGKLTARALARRDRAVRRLLDRGYRPFEIQALTGVKTERVHSIRRAAVADRSELTKDLGL